MRTFCSEYSRMQSAWIYIVHVYHLLIWAIGVHILSVERSSTVPQMSRSSNGRPFMTNDHIWKCNMYILLHYIHVIWLLDLRWWMKVWGTWIPAIYVSQQPQADRWPPLTAIRYVYLANDYKFIPSNDNIYIRYHQKLYVRSINLGCGMYVEYISGKRKPNHIRHHERNDRIIIFIIIMLWI